MTREEYTRLYTTLGMLPTTEEDDQQLLEATSPAGARRGGGAGHGCGRGAAGRRAWRAPGALRCHRGRPRRPPSVCCLAEWREATILRFRLMRKRALRQAMLRVGETLKAMGYGGEEAEGAQGGEEARAEL